MISSTAAPLTDPMALPFIPSVLWHLGMCKMIRSSGARGAPWFLVIVRCRTECRTW